MALQLGVFCAATFGAEEIVSWLGFDASYTDRPQFLRLLGLFFGAPALVWFVAGVARFQIELEDKRSEAARIEALLSEPVNDSLPPLGSDSRPRLTHDRGWDRLPPTS